ncbi:hypothetical protein SAMN04515647_4655 [Cohaesibacter sp. ES.047]|uniref:DUF2065 domain-containing protein n=1 Tax=Cohaesibacter sp. ES.047 TaxID=1798205 RepID=UPI000BB6C5B1|nr:DUF2065 domain-containing protein [Cohaesibacter sp. ES.047]SNY94335.1 hypothetical protein SAMN04515647_4655 [Cohaesibacter sp. ES.047]
MSDFIAAFGLVLVIEGLLYAVAPDSMKHMMQQVMEMPGNALRIGGVVAMIAGVFVVWLARG